MPKEPSKTKEFLLNEIKNVEQELELAEKNYDKSKEVSKELSRKIGMEKKNLEKDKLQLDKEQTELNEQLKKVEKKTQEVIQERNIQQTQFENELKNVQTQSDELQKAYSQDKNLVDKTLPSISNIIDKVTTLEVKESEDPKTKLTQLANNASLELEKLKNNLHKNNEILNEATLLIIDETNSRLKKLDNVLASDPEGDIQKYTNKITKQIEKLEKISENIDRLQNLGKEVLKKPAQELLNLGQTEKELKHNIENLKKTEFKNLSSPISVSTKDKLYKINKDKENLLNQGLKLNKKLTKHEENAQNVSSLERKLSQNQNEIKVQKEEISKLEQKLKLLKEELQLETQSKKPSLASSELSVKREVQSAKTEQISIPDSPNPGYATVHHEPKQIESFAQVKKNITPEKSHPKINLFDQLKREELAMSKNDKPSENKFDFDKAGEELAQFEKDLKEKATGSQKTTSIKLDSPQTVQEGEKFDLEKELAQFEKVPGTPQPQTYTVTLNPEKKIEFSEGVQKQNTVIIDEPQAQKQNAVIIDEPQAQKQNAVIIDEPQAQKQNATIKGETEAEKIIREMNEENQKQQIFRESSKSDKQEQELDKLVEEAKKNLNPTTQKPKVSFDEFKELDEMIQKSDTEREVNEFLSTFKNEEKSIKIPELEGTHKKLEAKQLSKDIASNDLKKAYENPNIELTTKQSKKIAKELMKATTKEQQANFLYSAIIDGKDDVAKALEKEMNKGKTKSNPKKFKKVALEEIRAAAEKYKQEQQLQSSETKQQNTETLTQDVKPPRPNRPAPKNPPVHSQNNDDFERESNRKLGIEGTSTQLLNSSGVANQQEEEKIISKDKGQIQQINPTLVDIGTAKPQTFQKAETIPNRKEFDELNKIGEELGLVDEKQNQVKNSGFKDEEIKNILVQQFEKPMSPKIEIKTEQEEKIKSVENSEENTVKQALSNFKTKNEQGRYASNLILEFEDLKPIVEKQLLEQKGSIKWSQEEVNKIKDNPEQALKDYNKLAKQEKEETRYTKVDIDKEINQVNKLTGEDLAKKDPGALAQTLLQNKSPDQQRDILYSAVIERREDIIGVLKNQMRSNGISNIAITNTLVAGEKTAKLENKYTKIVFPDPQNPLIKKFGSEIETRDPQALAQSLLQNKSKDEQANILYSAIVDGKGDRMFQALTTQMINNGFKNTELVDILTQGKRGATTEFAREVAAVRLADLENKIDLGDPKKERELQEKEKDMETESKKTEKHEEKTIETSHDTAGFDNPSTTINSPSKPGEETKPTDTPSKTGLESSSITEAMRKEVLEKQNLVLQNAIAGDLKDAKEKEKIAGMNPDAFREYLKTEEGKKLSAEQMKKPEVKVQLNEVSANGYHKVHESFKDNFKAVGWEENKDNPNTKTSQIKNDKGDVVADLKETTHKTTPVSLQLEDGTTKTVSSYRTIDFPKNLENQKGPLHLSMALKDENGKNMPEKGALYFSAHYDKSGKLTEVTSPQPVKFMGEGKDAIGYIEKDGQVFTLPVNREKYEEMMLEVAANKGHSVDLSQKIAKESAQDKFTVQEKKEEKEKENPKEVESQNKGVMGKDIETKGKEITENLHKDTKEEKKPVVQEKTEDKKEQKPEVKNLQDFVLSDKKEENLKQMDKILAGKKPEEVQKMLIDEISKGHKETVKGIVEATSQSRKDKPKDTPQLTEKDFKIAYHKGMDEGAKAPDKAMQDKVHRAGAEVATAGKISPQTHQMKVAVNTKELNYRLDKGMNHSK